MITTNEELVQLAELTEQILEKTATPNLIRDVEARGESWDHTIWQELAGAGILGVALPESVGGMGMGFDAVHAIVETQGAFVAPVPLWTTMVAHRSLATSSDASLGELLERACEGHVRVTLALEEVANGDLMTPRTSATNTASGWVLTGNKTMIPHAGSATHALVSAETPEGAGLFLIDIEGPKQQLERSLATNRDQVGLLDLTEAPAVAVHVGDLQAFEHLIREAFLAHSALQIGVAKGALSQTCEYVSAREQFGRPIGSFQSLQHLLANSSIDIDAADMTHALAEADHDADRDEALRSVYVAAWWANEAAANTVYRCQHVHGGLGVDVDYPIHRFFLAGRQSAYTLASSETLLEQLGNMLAAPLTAS